MNEDIHISVHKKSELAETQPRRASKIKSSKLVLSMQTSTKVKPHKKVQVQGKAVQVAIEKKNIDSAYVQSGNLKLKFFI